MTDRNYWPCNAPPDYFVTFACGARHGAVVNTAVFIPSVGQNGRCPEHEDCRIVKVDRAERGSHA